LAKCLDSARNSRTYLLGSFLACCEVASLLVLVGPRGRYEVYFRFFPRNNRYRGVSEGLETTV